jgi:hypothetical protein
MDGVFVGEMRIAARPGVALVATTEHTFAEFAGSGAGEDFSRVKIRGKIAGHESNESAG